jgi:hypothetical protein
MFLRVLVFWQVNNTSMFEAFLFIGLKLVSRFLSQSLGLCIFWIFPGFWG